MIVKIKTPLVEGLPFFGQLKQFMELKLLTCLSIISPSTR